jgi:hypothetical protein
MTHQKGNSMPYSAEINRDKPTLFMFVIDQSGSMDDKTETGRTKAQFVSDVLNKTLYTLVSTCSKADGVRNYFEVAVLGYGGSNVTNGFGGALTNSIIHPIEAVANNPLRVEERKKLVDDGAGGVIEQSAKFPVWFDPKQDGGTPMRQALATALDHLASWCDAHSDSYPPTILHVTDGASTDGDPSDAADAIKKISTSDGSCLLFNLHVTGATGRDVLFPDSVSAISDPYARQLFDMSSPMPNHVLRYAGSKGYSLSDGARGYIFNGDAKGIVDFFDIGTRAATMNVDPNR